MPSDAGTVRVVVRIRPQNQIELKRGGLECVKLLSDTEVEVGCDDGDFRYTFDRILGPKSTQHECFECVASPIVDDVLQGYNATIFAYGQTSSGKTHTMEGPSIDDPELRGIIPRTVSSLFEGVGRADPNLEFTVKVAYIEIYMERIRDLLDRFHTKVNLAVREDPNNGVYVSGVTEEYCTCERELLEIMKQGAANRATAATGMNEGSSRSHSVFMVTVKQRNLETTSQRSGKLFLVDLAGSEIVRKTNATGQQLEEAKTINKSLSALGLVINALTEDRPSHVPYRDSKLTRVLQDSLGGNAKTVLLVNCSPSSYNANETLSTLRFGSRAKRITNKPKINEQRSVEELTILLQKAENAIDMQQSYIEALEGQLRACDGGGGGAGLVAAAGDGTVALQGKVVALATELSEERDETLRARTEVSELTAVLREKERLLGDASELLRGAERHCEGLRARSEALEMERLSAQAEGASAADALSEAEMRAAFEISELRATVEKLSGANERLTAELEAKEAEDAARTLEESSSRASSRSPPPPSSAAAESLPVSASVRLSDEQLVGLAEAIGLSAAGLDWVRQREHVWEQWAATTGPRGDDVSQLEAAKARIAAELQLAAEKNMELEMQLSALMQGPDADKAMTAREKNHVRMQKKFESLQQRLEQLVAVHRQLLRKYAALELDSAEDKKKISLRDERISQLEANTRTLAMNMRTQAARHVVELTKLREQVSTVRQEQIQQRQELAFSSDHGSGPRAVLRGGGAGARAIRGGGLEVPRPDSLKVDP